jgi:lipoyl-dependent peroxiredoxin
MIADLAGSFLAAYRIKTACPGQIPRCAQLTGYQSRFTNLDSRLSSFYKKRNNKMAVRNADAVWEGALKDGKGRMKFGGGAFDGNYSYSSRFENGVGTNPEELLGAAHAGCFSMALSAGLGKSGFTPRSIHTRAQVTLESVDGKSRITRIHLDTEASVPGINNDQFQEIALATKETCPVSVALSNVPVTLAARLVA